VLLSVVGSRSAGKSTDVEGVAIGVCWLWNSVRGRNWSYSLEGSCQVLQRLDKLGDLELCYALLCVMADTLGMSW